MNISLISSVQYSHQSKQPRPPHLSSRSQHTVVQSSNTLWEGSMPHGLVLRRDKKFIMTCNVGSNLATSQTQTEVDLNATSRPLANFHPCVWGNRFLLSDLDYDQLIKREEELSMKVESLTHKLKIELKETNEYPLKQLELIDKIQRLGVGYHFEGEIDQAMLNLYDNYADFYKSNNDLYSIALSFRVLRQNGHKVSCDIFDKFKDVKGEFKASLTSNVMGMLEFYEATYLSIQGEDVLDHGRAFARAHLSSVLPNISNTSVGEQISHALDYSNQRELPRLAARNYISIYEQHATRHETLLQLAKLDFNRLQCLHKRELSELYSWWTETVDVKKNFWYARDRCVENYLWAYGAYFEPQYSIARKHLFKFFALTIFIDDTYDAYGTSEELQVFTEAIMRWSVSCPDSLPGYMKVLYRVVMEVVEEIEEEMATRGVDYRMNYGKETVNDWIHAYFDEIKWREGKHTPGIMEYMSVATRTSCYVPMTIFAYMGLGDIATKEAFDWILNNPPLTKAANTVARLTGDMVHHEFESERDHPPSAVECYMKEYGVSKQETYDELNRRIEIGWKEMNEALLRPRKFPAPILNPTLNLTRVIESVYKNGEWFTHVGPEMKSYITQLFIDPIPE